MAKLSIVFLGLLTLALPIGTARGSLVETADSLYFAQAWTEAAALYEEIVVVDPGDAESAYRLALSHHLAGDFAKAIPAHRAAARHLENRANALYNLACAYAQLGDVELALEALDGSLEAGFQDNNLLLQDAELNPIREEPRFEEILRRLLGEGYTGFGGPGPTPEAGMVGDVHTS